MKRTNQKTGVERCRTSVNGRIAILLLFLVIPFMGLRAAGEDPLNAENSTAPQQQQVSGTIIDSDGEAIPGASVVIKGTTRGTITDVSGQYSIEAGSNDVLIISYVGMTTQEITVGGQTTIDVSMEIDALGLDEVVVIGYGTQKRSDLTGSITSVAMDEIAAGSVSSINEAMQGRAAGVAVNASDGSPGGGINIRIRGTSTINGTTEPLYIIDGLPVNTNSNEQYVGGGIRESTAYNNNRPNALSMLNPNDIESMEILKDASATAIYGARGANGVVLIKTKRGQAGKMQVNFDYSFGMQTPAKKYEKLTGPEYTQRVNESYVNGGYDYVLFDGSQWYYPTPANAETTDWQDLVYSNAPVHEATLGMNGGNENTKYALSFNFMDQEGIMVGSDYSRFSTRMNLDQKISKRITAGASLNFIREGRNQNSTDGINNVTRTLGHPTYMGVEWWDEENARWFVDPLDVYGSTNPAKMPEHTLDETVTNRFLGNAYFEVDILDGLKWRTTAGTDYSSAERNLYLDRTLYLIGPVPGGRADINNTNVNQMNGNSFLTYNKDMGNSVLNVVAGAELSQMVRTTRHMNDSDFATDIVLTDAIGSGAGIKGAGSSKSQWTSAGFFGRLNFNIAGKYMITANARYDGSSRFGAENKWGFFPSIAGAWRISEESFMDNANIISNWKVRVSYGLTGNGDIPMYSSMGTWRVNGNQYSYNGGNGGPAVVSGAYLDRIPNPDLKWETTKQFNIGTDISILANRLGLIFDYFDKNTTDLILNVNIPLTSGFTTSRQNIGALKNSGFEFTVYGVPVSTSDFSWDMNFNLTILRAEAVDIGDNAYLDANVPSEVRRPGMRLEVGQPAGIIRGLIKEGVFSTQADADAAASHGSGNNTAGYYQYTDANGDNMIDANDVVPIGNGQPDFVWGFSNTLTYKGFDLYVFFQGSYGNEISKTYGTDSPYYIMDNEWKQSGDVAKYAMNRKGGNGYAGGGFGMDTYNVWSGTYLRLKNLRLGYSFPVKDVPWIAKAKIYVMAQNLFTLTEYPGYNPDVSGTGSWAFSEGWDLGAYPMSKTFKVGVNLTF